MKKTLLFNVCSTLVEFRLINSITSCDPSLDFRMRVYLVLSKEKLDRLLDTARFIRTAKVSNNYVSIVILKLKVMLTLVLHMHAMYLC